MDSLVYCMKAPTPLGEMLMAEANGALFGAWFLGQKYYASTLEDPIFGEKLPVFQLAENWLNKYFKGENPELNLPLAPKGSDFRHKVWNILLKIPYGEVITYGEIAKQLEKWGISAIEAGLERISPSQAEAARSLGCTGFAEIRRVYLPLLKGG